MIATCNKCREFSCPWDEIGKALMAQHLKGCTGKLLEPKTTNVAPAGCVCHEYGLPGDGPCCHP